MKTILYTRRHPKTKLYEFYHICPSSTGRTELWYVYHKEATRYPNKCVNCFFQIPSVYLMGGNNQEFTIFANKSDIARGSLRILKSDIELYDLQPIPDLL